MSLSTVLSKTNEAIITIHIKATFVREHNLITNHKTLSAHMCPQYPEASTGKSQRYLSKKCVHTIPAQRTPSKKTICFEVDNAMSVGRDICDFLVFSLSTSELLLVVYCRIFDSFSSPQANAFLFPLLSLYFVQYMQQYSNTMILFQVSR